MGQIKKNCDTSVCVCVLKWLVLLSITTTDALEAEKISSHWYN